MSEKPNMSQKEKIKLAAMKVFSQKGFHNSSVQEIVDEAGVKKSLFFYYFQSKENLFVSIFKEHMEDILEKFHSVSIQKISTRDKLEAILEFESQFYIDILQKGILRWGIQSMDECKDVINLLKDDFLVMLSLVAGIIEEGISEGVFRKIDPELTAITILSVHHALLKNKVLFDKEISKEKFKVFLNTLFLEGLML